MITPALDRLRRLGQSRLWDFAAAALAALALVRLAGILPDRVTEFDFNHYYAGGRLVWEGANPYRAPLAEIAARYGFATDPVMNRASNTPAFLWCFAPLTALPPAAAFVVWTGAQALSLAVALALTIVLLGGRLTPRGWRLFALAVIGSAPVTLHFAAAQLQLTLAALLLAALAALRRGWGRGACLLVVVAGAWKLFPLALLPWFVWRGPGGWGARAGRAAGSAAALAVIWLVTGPALWADFFEFGLEVVRRSALEKGPHIASLNQTFVSFVSDLEYAARGFATPVVSRVALAAGLGLLAAAYAVVLTGRRDEDLEFGILSVALVAATPVAWSHYFVLLIFPLAALVGEVRRRPTPARVTGVAVVAALFLDPGLDWQTWLSDRHSWAGILGAYLMLYATLALGGWLAWENRAGPAK